MCCLQAFCFFLVRLLHASVIILTRYKGKHLGISWAFSRWDKRYDITMKELS